MDIRKIKKLIELVEESGIAELEISEGEESVRISRVAPGQAAPVVSYAMPQAAAPVAAPVAAAAPAAAAPAAEPSGHLLRSPMVGTFYASPSPDKPSFVSVGGDVGPNSVVCLVEAMKIFNEIKAERSGTIAKVLVKSGQAVEFGQPLYMIKPS